MSKLNKVPTEKITLVNEEQAKLYQTEFAPQIDLHIILENLTLEEYNDAVNTTVKENNGKGGKLMVSVFNLCVKLFEDSDKTEIEVKKSIISHAIGMSQLYNYFSADAFQNWGVTFTPPTKKAVKAHIDKLKEKIKVSKKLESNSKLEGIKNFEGFNAIAYDIWAVRGKAVVNSHIVKDGDSSQFNKAKYGYNITAIDKELTRFLITKI